MPLEGNQVERLQHALIKSFTRDDLHKLVAVAWGEDFEILTTVTKKDAQVLEIIEHAVKTYTITKLIAAAFNQNNKSPIMRELVVEAARSWRVCTDRGLTCITDYSTQEPRAYLYCDRQGELDYLNAVLSHFEKSDYRYVPIQGVLTPALVQVASGGVGTGGGERATVGDVCAAVIELMREKKKSPDRHGPANCCVLLVGAAGAGKTAVLERLMYELSAVAIASVAAPLPVFVRLDAWDGKEELQTLVARCFVDQWSETTPSQTNLGESLPAYLYHGRAVLLIDDLELALDSNVAEKAIRKLLGEFPKAGAVLAIRSDSLQRKKEQDRLDISPLGAQSQREYLARRLGETAGDSLHRQLVNAGLGVSKTATAGERAQLPELARTPLLLELLIEVFQKHGDADTNLGQLMHAGVVERILDRERSRAESAGRTYPDSEELRHALAKFAVLERAAKARGRAPRRSQALRVMGGPFLDAAMDAGFIELIPSDHANAVPGSAAGAGHLAARSASSLYAEYFLALALQWKLDCGRGLKRLWPQRWVVPSGWEEPALLLAGFAPQGMDTLVAALTNVNPTLAARCIGESGGEAPDYDVVRPLRDRLTADATGSELPYTARCTAADALNYVGDGRAGVGLTGKGLPEIEWVVIPAGEFLAGGAPFGAETKVTLPEYAISRYPVTNAQFAAFVNDRGYRFVRYDCWADDGWAWLERTDISAPLKYGGRFDYDNHPVVGVSWYEADAFCKWLGKKLNLTVSLPTSLQWEKAARGTDGRQCPHGGELTAEHANYRASGLESTSAVGVFPLGASPYGLLDASGNVWEWTCDTDGLPEGEERKYVLRGGSFEDSARGVTCISRSSGFADMQRECVGFRVVLSDKAT